MSYSHIRQRGRAGAIGRQLPKIELAECELSPQNAGWTNKRLARDQREQMKAMQKLLAGAVAVLGIGFGYHYFFSTGLDEKVREHGETMVRHEEALDRHDTEIQETRQEAADNTERIEVVFVPLDNGALGHGCVFDGYQLP